MITANILGYEDSISFVFEDVETFQYYYDHTLQDSDALVSVEFNGTTKACEPVPVSLRVIKGGKDE